MSAGRRSEAAMASDHVRSAHGILILERGHRIIRDLGKRAARPALYGTQVWRSSFTLMSYLESHPIEPAQRVLEVGCGWGLSGIFCAKRFGAEVLLTDADERVFPYVRAHEALNGVSVSTARSRMEDLSDERLQESDLIIGSDICFWPELVTALRGFIERALDRGTGGILLADPGRLGFLRLAEWCDNRFGAKLVPWQGNIRARNGGYVLALGAQCL
jgi:predicted nicotinamide N-methyase